MGPSFADLNPTAFETARVTTLITDCLRVLPDNWDTATFDEMGLDAWDRMAMQIDAEFRFRVELDAGLAGTDTAADLLTAVRAAAKLGELPHA